jgi:hypothetical protein
LACRAWKCDDASVSSNSLLRIGFKPADSRLFFCLFFIGGRENSRGIFMCAAGAAWMKMTLTMAQLPVGMSNEHRAVE